MSYVSPEQIAKAREMDLLTYLRLYDPQELVRFGGNTYCTREHDSLKISNGKWYWFSRGIGGASALDYLVKVKDVPFVQAVEQLSGQAAMVPSATKAKAEVKKPKVLLLPPASRCATHAVSYLASRGIDYEIINYCIQTGRLYESYPHHNVVFVGLDRYNKSRYANLRGVHSDFKGEANGSDKRFSFSIPAPGSNTVHLFESAIDLLSYATMLKLAGQDWRQDHLLSLAGVFKPKENIQESSLPLALRRYLGEHPEIRTLVLRLDNDATGRLATKTLTTMLSDQYEIITEPPPHGKDYNDSLCFQRGIPIAKPKGRHQER